MDNKHKEMSERKSALMRMPDGFVPQDMPCQPEKPYGIAFDIGTTTVAGVLWRLTEEKPLGTLAMTNPQIRYGADVITRIQYTLKKHENIKVLADEIRQCLSKMTLVLCETCGVSAHEIGRASVAGNTTMSHLFLERDPASLARAPFAPAYTGSVRICAKECKLSIDDESDVYILPGIAGHVGGDITAAVLAAGLVERQGLHLLIDIGTNGEIVLAKDGRMLACSTAAGPAFEGAGITCGMRAAAGAIEKMDIHSGELRIKTIEDAEPVGICGSGLIDIIACLLELGVINPSGRLLAAEDFAEGSLSQDMADRFCETKKGDRAFIIAGHGEKAVVLTQEDIRQVQMAKGAILGGILVMLKELGKTVEDMDTAGIAGAFGSCIDMQNAVRIGLLPDISIRKINTLGNAAGAGACMAMLSAAERDRAEQIAMKTEHIELASHPDFERAYMKGMRFPARQSNQE